MAHGKMNMTDRTYLRSLCAAVISFAIAQLAYAQHPPPHPRFAETKSMPPLFFREGWKQTGPFDASTGFEPERAVTSAAVTNASLELRLYDPGAGNIASYAKNPPPGSIARDWGGPTCIQ